MGKGKRDKEKFDNFLNNLSINEKLYFVLLTEVENSDSKANKIFEEYQVSGDKKLLEKLMAFTAQKTLKKEKKLKKYYFYTPKAIILC